MKFTNKDKTLELSIDESLIEEIGKIALNQYPNEFGGFLLGKYSLDFKKVIIEKFILPKKYHGTPTEFYRSTDNIKKVFETLYYDQGLYYIGEWHSHPNGNSKFSATDLKAMREVAKCDTVKIKNPILLILSIGKRKLNDYSFYLYEKNKLIEYE